MRTLAVLPVKSFGSAKQRLGGAVGADERRALARAMVGDVLEALSRVEGLSGVLVVTAERPWAGLEESDEACAVPAAAIGPAFEPVHEPGQRSLEAAAFERVHDPVEA